MCEHRGGTAGAVAANNLLLSLQDGKCFALLLSHYIPQAGSELKGVCVCVCGWVGVGVGVGVGVKVDKSGYSGVAFLLLSSSPILHVAISASPQLPDSLMQVQSVCSSWLPPPALHFHPPALATHPYEPIWRLHLLVSLAHLFWCFEGDGRPLVGPQALPHSAPLTLQTPIYAKPPSGAEGRREMLGSAVRMRGYSSDRLSSTSDTSLAATRSDTAATQQRATFHPPLRQSGSLSQLPLHGDPTSRITASVTGLVRDAGQKRVASHLRVRRTSSTSSLGAEQRGGLGEDIADSASTAGSTTGGSETTVASETATGCHPQGQCAL